MNIAIAALTVAVGAASFGANAQVYFDQFENGTGSCQAALPSYEGNIRKRPLAIQNEGTTAAFVTCSPQQFLDLYDETYGSRILITNAGTAALSVSCTSVDIGSGATPVYTAKTVDVPAGARVALDFDGEVGFTYGSFSCNLPPNAGIYGVASYSGAEYVAPAR